MKEVSIVVVLDVASDILDWVFDSDELQEDEDNTFEEQSF